jgi:hypothetical protein
MLRAGIVPMQAQTPDSIVTAGASMAIAPSGGLNPIALAFYLLAALVF